MSPSQIAPATPEPLDATPRRAMTPARRLRAIAKSDGHCAYPGCDIEAPLQIDHVIALELGGKDEDENLQPLCIDHHKQKTALDAKLIGKMRRRHKKHTTPLKNWPKTQLIRSRGFQSRWEK